MQQGKLEQSSYHQQLQMQQETPVMNKTQTQKEKNTQSKQKNHKTWGDEIGENPPTLFESFYKTQGVSLPWREGNSH